MGPGRVGTRSGPDCDPWLRRDPTTTTGWSVPGVVGWGTSMLRCLGLQEGHRAGAARGEGSPRANSDSYSLASFSSCVTVGKLLNLSEL